MKVSQQPCGDGKMVESVSTGHHRMSERVFQYKFNLGTEIRSAFSQPEPGEELFRELRRLPTLQEGTEQ